jgi:hypothetical protein
LPAKSERELIEQAVAHAVDLANICDLHPPCPPSLPVELLCVSHRAIGARVPIDSRHASKGLCAACGRFCLDTGALAIPPEIVRMLSKGKYRQARRPDVLRRYQVKYAPHDPTNTTDLVV